jgi:Putative beta-barrel porin-2, OmpL-like. bbp2
MRCISISGLFAALLVAATAAQADPAPDCDPYKDYSCLGARLGTGVVERFFNYYGLENGHAAAPADPNAPSSHREGWPATPATTPPYPFTEWPYGAATSLGVSLPNAVDSPLMVSVADTSLGQALQDGHIQVYGWVNGGFNVSSNSRQPGGNAPMAYFYTPNTAELDQVVLYAERVPDTVQTDHIDWGFRVSALYGENYRYTTAYGIASYQLLNHNLVNGYDFPMMYAEVYIPQVMEGLLIRVGRYISIPDIEAQLAPNNYMYSHSMMYSFDNYTNEGVVASLALKKNLILQLGVVDGTETAIWNGGDKLKNLDPNPLYPNATFDKDPGFQPSLVACLRYTWNDGADNIYPCADGINDGHWGYNNLQWYGFTYYHRFNDKWHMSFEAYDLFQRGVANVNNPVAASALANGGTPFSPQFIPFNAPNAAQCAPVHLTCTAMATGFVTYLNYQFSPLDNLSIRPELFDDMQGQRTGVATSYANFGIGWQHWFSPQIEIRPEVDFDYSLDRDAFNGNSLKGLAPNKRYSLVGAMDAIVHF